MREAESGRQFLIPPGKEGQDHSATGFETDQPSSPAIQSSRLSLCGCQLNSAAGSCGVGELNRTQAQKGASPFAGSQGGRKRDRQEGRIDQSPGREAEHLQVSPALP